MKKLLIFADSRGHFKHDGFNGKLYFERLETNFKVEKYLCPCKWTTTIDFFEFIESNNINLGNYDAVILHTGIVEHSPRPYNQALNMLYHNSENHKLVNNGLHAYKYENSKKKYMDKIFTEKEMKEHFSQPFDTMYDEEKTINMYSVDMMNRYLVPKLLEIKNLIYISSNKIVKGWNGNYWRSRPDNIDLVEQYSDELVKQLPHTVNLNVWSPDDVKKYTCDNMHLTRLGSDYIYDHLLIRIDKVLNKSGIVNMLIAPKKNVLIVMGNGPSLKDQNFDIIKQFDSFGLNAAYRMYEKMNFWPTYFGCFDFLVSGHHTPEFRGLIGTSPIKKFFFVNQDMFTADNTVNYNTKFQKFNFVRNVVPQTISKSFDTFVDMGSTGANAVQVGIILGYKKIILLGCDCNYVEQIDGAILADPNSKVRLKMDYTPSQNPNYWFDDYQREGDLFNLPRTNIFQMPSWQLISKLCPKDVLIINCSPVSKIPYFKISTLEKELVNL